MAQHQLGPNAGPAARANHVASVMLVELLSQVAGSSVVPIRLTSGWYDVTWNGATWAASGRLLDIEPITESLSAEAQEVRFKISAVPSDLRSLALDATYAYPGRPITIYKAILDGAYQVLDTPDVVFAGLVNRMTITDRGGRGDGTSEVVIAAVSKYIRLRNPQERRLSDEQQRAMFPNVLGGQPDRGLEFLTKMREDNTAPFGVR